MLAQSSLKTGRYLEASREFDAYVDEVGGEIPPKVQNLVDNGRREAKAHLGRLRFDVPEGAEVVVDGEPVASVDAPIDVMPGVHTITITHHDEKKTQTVEAVVGATVEVRPAFVPKALVPTSEARTRPTPPPEPDLSTRESPESPSLTPPNVTWPIYVAGAIGLGGLGAAAIFGGLYANSAHAIDVTTETLIRNGKTPSNCASPNGWASAAGQNNDAERTKYEETCIALGHNQDVQQLHAQAFQVSILIGLSGTAFAAAWFFLAPKGHRDQPTQGRTLVTPWVGTSGGGVNALGRF
jgi:hypothetical protein